MVNRIHLIRPQRRRGQQPAISILEAMSDPNLFGQHFTNTASWKSWKAFLSALFGLPLNDEQFSLFKECTGRSGTGGTGFNEAWLVCGRRAGKSFILALVAVYLATLKNWKRYLGPGEVATIPIIAADRKQARVIMRYVKGLLTSVPMFSRMIADERAETVTLNNRVVIEVHTASYRTTRGYTIAAALLDELAFWSTSEDSAEPDREIITALRPAMATIPGAMLLCASSPYARRGAMWEAYRKHHGKDSSTVLVWKAPTRAMNPTVSQSFVDEQYADDPASAAAEYGAQFRTDVESFISREAIEGSNGSPGIVSRGVLEREPERGITYSGFVDPSGGSSDSFTCAIAHRSRHANSGSVVVLDAIREVRPPFSPESVVEEFSVLLKSYGIFKVTGDRYAGQWPVEAFKKFGITYEQGARPKSDLYRDLLPAINSKQIDLLDHKKLVNQLCSLERRTGRGGRDSIDHPPNQHDDLANAAAGAITSLIGGSSSYAWRTWPPMTPRSSIGSGDASNTWGVCRYEEGEKQTMTTATIVEALDMHDAGLRLTADGYLAVQPRIARSGIQTYHGYELGRPELGTVRVYRPEEEVFHKDAMRSFAHRPVTVDHPPVMVDASNWKKYAVGHTGDEIIREGDAIRVPMLLLDAQAIADVKNGKKQLSAGYYTEIKWEKGTTPTGEGYDARQTNIRGNHIAICYSARGGPMLRLGDSFAGFATEERSTMDSHTVTQPTAKRYQWNGNSDYQLRRPGFRPRTLLKDAASTDDIAAMDAAKSLNEAYDKLHEKRARQAAEVKEMFNELMYQRR
jgi:hypothetical protein